MKTVAALSKLKDSLQFVSSSEGFTQDPKKLIGVNEHNVYPWPYGESYPYPYFIIKLGSKHVFPTSYMLQGRRYNHNLLVSWKFEGKRQDETWETLHSCTGCEFQVLEKRVYKIKKRKTYNEFKLSMTERDNISMWALCINQIEVYGAIFNEERDNIRMQTIVLLKKEFIHIFIILFLVKS